MCSEAEGRRRAYLQIVDAVLGDGWSHNQTQPHKISENKPVNYYAQPCKGFPDEVSQYFLWLSSLMSNQLSMVSVVSKSFLLISGKWQAS